MRALRQEEVYSNARRGLDSSNNGTLPLAEGIKILGKNSLKISKTTKPIVDFGKAGGFFSFSFSFL